MLIWDSIIGIMLGELKRIGNNDRIFFDMRKYPVLDSGHLLRQEIDVNIIVNVNIGLKKIFFEKTKLRIAQNTIEELAIYIGEMLNFITIARYTKSTRKKPHRFTITTS